METVLRITIDIFCSQIIVLLFAGMQNKRDRKKLDYRLFTFLILLVTLILLADTARLLAEDSETVLGKFVLGNAAFLLFAANPFIGMLYALYVEQMTLPSHRRKKRILIIYFIPAISILCFSFFSLFTHWLFYIDENGSLRYGPFLHFGTVVFYGYLAWASILAISRRKTINPRVFNGMVSVPVPMAVCGVLQLIFPDLVLLIPSYALSMIVLNSNIQERRLMYDYLTGAFNRRRLDEYLDALMREARQSGKTFSAFLADVNDFKRINDSYGHIAGDEALVSIVNSIRGELRFDDIVARYAGDEFVVVLPNTRRSELAEVTARVHAAVGRSRTADPSYSHSISIGAAEFPPGFEGDAEDFISELDSLMYEEKKSYHEERGSKAGDRDARL